MEKVLAQSNAQLNQILTALNNENVWVNTPRRITSLYQRLKNSLNKRGPISFLVNDPKFALACNCIHFIDAVSYLTGSRGIDVSIKSESGWLSSKRHGYLEFKGTVEVFYEDSSSLKIDNNNGVKTSIKCLLEKDEYTIFESEGIYKNGIEICKGRLEYQSELTAYLLTSIIENNTNKFLPTLQESVAQHKLFFKGLNDEPSLSKSSSSIWPIT